MCKQLYIQSDCYVKSCQCTANSSFAAWNFLEFFSPNIFHLRLVESPDAEPVNTEGQLYIVKEGYIYIQEAYKKEKQIVRI